MVPHTPAVDPAAQRAAFGKAEAALHRIPLGPQDRVSLTLSTGGSRETIERFGAAIDPAAEMLQGATPAAAWVFVDLDGKGPRWHLALRGAPGDGPDEIRFPFEDFSDDADSYADCASVPIPAPGHLPPPAQPDGG